MGLSSRDHVERMLCMYVQSSSGVWCTVLSTEYLYSGGLYLYWYLCMYV